MQGTNILNFTGDTMAITSAHYNLVRDHFIALLGGECCVCGSVFSLEIHHKIPMGMGEGRGREVRMWEWYVSYWDKNLSLLCNTCHKKFHS